MCSPSLPSPAPLPHPPDPRAPPNSAASRLVGGMARSRPQCSRRPPASQPTPVGDPSTAVAAATARDSGFEIHRPGAFCDAVDDERGDSLTGRVRADEPRPSGRDVEALRLLHREVGTGTWPGPSPPLPRPDMAVAETAAASPPSTGWRSVESGVRVHDSCWETWLCSGCSRHPIWLCCGCSMCLLWLCCGCSMRQLWLCIRCSCCEMASCRDLHACRGWVGGGGGMQAGGRGG